MLQLWAFISNLLGVFTFSFDGSYQSSSNDAPTSLAVVTGLISAYGGGSVFRDLLFLNQPPAILFTNVVELLFSIACAMTGVWASCNDLTLISTINSPLNQAIFTVADTVGLVAFAKAGVDKAFLYRPIVPVVILCGFVSCCGGGFIRLLITRGIRIALRSSMQYRCFSLTIVLGYLICRDEALVLIMAIVTGLLLNKGIQQQFKKIYRKQVMLHSADSRKQQNAKHNTMDYQKHIREFNIKESVKARPYYRYNSMNRRYKR